MRTIGQAFFLAFLALLMLSGCSQSGPSLMVYTALEHDQIPRYLVSFQKKYPKIKVNVVRDSTGIIAARLLAERERPVADVVWGLAASHLLLLERENLFAPYAPKGLERIEPRFRDNADPPRWVGIDAYMTGIVVNTIEAKKKNLPIPTSYADLVKPVYRGMLVMPNPASSGTGFLTVSAFLQVFGEEKGWDYMEKLHANMALYTHSGSKPAKLAGQGEYPIGISFGYRGIIQKRRGEPVRTVFPREGSGWELEANALVKKKSIQPAAKLFLDWAISDAAMAEYGKSFAVLAVKEQHQVPEGFPSRPRKQLIRNDLRWAATRREAILTEWNRRFATKSEAKNR